jgi:hypothetical protein
MFVALLAAVLLSASQESAADVAPMPCDASLQVCPVTDPKTGQPRVYPADVTRFQEDIETCIHFAGEEPYDADRRRQIEAAVRKHCDGANKRLPGLRKKYAADPVNLERIEAIQAFRVGAGL